MDDLNPSTEKTYLHHYNFPPYSVGETRPMRTPGRREIGHGALAERAIIPVLPGKETFPYVLRVVSEVLSSCLLYTSPSPRDKTVSRMPSSA